MLRLAIKTLILTFVLVFLPSFFCLAKTVKYEDQTWDVSTIQKTIAPTPIIRNNLSLEALSMDSLQKKPIQTMATLWNDETIAAVDTIIASENKKATNASLVIKDDRAVNFDPGQEGRAVDLNALNQKLTTTNLEVDLPIVTSKADTSLNETNDLGINELVATGESSFKGSPKNRLHNIRVGAEKYNGLIIKPGQEFSFNQYLGDVDGEHGFLPELVIKKTGVEPEFGGGLCQVSSTTFRAAMNAGLPITARRNHSFAVQYYAPQGTDATIYPGSQDLKFINNLSSHLLIRTRIEGIKLYFDLFGTKDDRLVAFDGPYQYDKKTDGSMKATWTRRVTFNNETTEQIFKSTYQPPALFHKETVAATPNPDSNPPPSSQTPENTTPPISNQQTQ